MTSISVRWMNLDTPMKHQMKHHQVFIWDETCFSSEIKHLHFNEINFLLFHLRRHVKNSGFVLYHGFQIPRNRWKHSACGLVLSSVSRYLEPVIKHSPSFLTYYVKHVKYFTLWKMQGNIICEILNHVRNHVKTFSQIHMLFHMCQGCEHSCENILSISHWISHVCEVHRRCKKLCELKVGW